MANHCLNCNQTIDRNFCQNCGQKASTHRFSLKHFILNAFVNGVFNLDKGFFYTIKELFVRPGHSIRDYIEGKRVKHFNYLTFIILIITTGHIVGNISEINLIDSTHYFTTDKSILQQFDKITKEYPKIFSMVKIPFLALFTFLFFRKSKNNFTEFLILNIYKVCGEMLIAITFTLLAILFKNKIPLNYFYSVVTILTFGYSVWYYFQYFSTFGYSKISLLLRSVLTTIILFLVTFSVTTFIIGMKTGFED
jgi:Protein of unknown function (DUF3667)